MGFCSGVTRAVKMVEQVLKLYGSVYITEDIIHNRVFMKQIYASGGVKVPTVEDVPDDAVVMFSAHGVPPDVVATAEKKGLTIIDGTCPIVRTLQMAVKKCADKGDHIVLIGHMSHPEIISLLGFVGHKNVYVVSNKIDLDMLPDFKNESVVYFTQTTLDCEEVSEIVSALKNKIPHISSQEANNVCFAVKARQDVVRKVAPIVDMLIVVGSKHSSNTTRLTETGARAGIKKVLRIDSKDEIVLSMFDEVSAFAVTAGTSVPGSIVSDLIEFLSANLDVTISEFPALENNEDNED
jgi:4-hydroxy-3-methylbut-2-enyl diphosphate reductase